MKKSKLIQVIISTAEIFFVTVFLVSVWQSDRALDKSGIGDPDKFTFWNRYSALSIKMFLFMWIIAVIYSLLTEKRINFISGTEYWKSLAADVLLPPLFLIVGWLLILV